MRKTHIDRGEFFPYINGRYVNPYEPKHMDPTIRKESKNETHSNKRRFKTGIIDSYRS